MTVTRRSCFHRLTILAAVLALVALFIAVEHHHESESSAQSCPICTFPVAITGILVVVVITVMLTQSGLVMPRRREIVRSLLVCWTYTKRGPPFLS
jgi:uncharacterized membrane protein